MIYLFRKYIFPFFFISFLFSDSKEKYIRQINFQGNENVTLREIFSIVRQRPPDLFFRRPKFNPRLLKLDALTLKSYYHSKGYLDVVVEESFIEQDNLIYISYKINEGKKYFLSKVDISGNNFISDSEIKKLLGLKVDEPYDPVFINNNLYLIENEYHQIGKLFMGIIIQDEIIDSVFVKVNINEGEDIFIKNTFLENIGDIDSSVIFRELTYKNGEKYSKGEIDNTTRRLREMGIFSMVNLIPIKVADSDSLVNMVIELSHYKQREWNSVGGYDPIQFADGAEPLPALSFTTEWKNRSFFNTPTQFSTKLLAGVPVEEEFIIPRIRYDITLSSNWFFKIRFPTKITGYYETFFTSDQNNSVIPISAIERRGINLSQHVRFDNRSYFETKSVLESFSDDSGKSNKNDNIEQRAVSLKLNIDKKDDPLFTRKGYLFFGVIKFVGFGAERDYLKLDLNFQSYFPLGGKTVFAMRYKFGTISGWNNYKDYSFEKFYLGGSTSMRGWDVLRFETENSDDPKGETNRFMTNIEIRKPIYKSIGITFFTDGGLLSSNIPDISFQKIKWDLGFGLTVQTPLGPARIDYAVQLKEPFLWKIQLGVQNLF